MNNLVDITLPADQLEGTEAAFSVWLVNQGDQVKEGQPIAELETDKVAMEVCALVSGVIHSLQAKQGDKVEPEQCLGKIDTTPSTRSKTAQKGEDNIFINSSNKSTEENSDNANQSLNSNSNSDYGSNRRHLVSPAVRRLLNQHNIKIDKIQASGKNGRVSRDDVLKFLKSNKVIKENVTLNSKQEKDFSAIQAKAYSDPLQSLPNNLPGKLQGQMIPHSNMRKSIASHMINSLLETSPHVTSVFEMDMGNIIQHRKQNKKKYAEQGVKLTFTAYFLAAMAKAVKIVPQVNARYHQEALEIFNDVNIGVGTSLGDAGLVVPVVQQVQSMTLIQIAKSLNQQTEKSRTGKLKSNDMKNGTITISNHGVSGSLFATPIIINQPQVAILGIGKLEKRVVVEEVNGADAIVIRPKCYVSLSIDHRALDAHQTNMFLSEFVSVIENWKF